MHQGSRGWPCKRLSRLPYSTAVLPYLQELVPQVVRVGQGPLAAAVVVAPVVAVAREVDPLGVPELVACVHVCRRCVKGQAKGRAASTGAAEERARVAPAHHAHHTADTRFHGARRSLRFDTAGRTWQRKESKRHPAH